jgi:hypothetical protein
MATVTYGLDVIYESQQWIVEQIQKVAFRITKDVAGLRATTAGCDAIRSADFPPTQAMLDRRTECHFIKMLTQTNPNSNLIHDEADGMVDEEDIPSLDSWTERAADDLWVLGNEVEQSVPIDLQFAPWHEDSSEDLQTGNERGHQRGLMPVDHDKYQRDSDGHSVDTANRIKRWNWRTTRDTLDNTNLRLKAKWRQSLTSWNL